MMVFKSNKKKSCTKNDGEVRKKASKKKQTKTTVGTSTTFKSKSRFKVRRNYSQEAVKQAVQAVQGGTSLRQAAKNYGVPSATIFRFVKNPNRINCSIGPKTVLTNEEENKLVDWILWRAQHGNPVTVEQLKLNIQSYILLEGRETPFKEGKPGRHWFESFKKRHPNISIRTPQNLTTVRASATEEHIRDWFTQLTKYFTEKGILNLPAERVFNCDETGVLFCPKPGKVLAEKGTRAVYQLAEENEKENRTVLFMFRADGLLAPPLIIYPYIKDIPERIIKNVPGHWGIGKTENGWMSKECFYEYIVNVFHPWLKAIDTIFPIILYFDGHSSHLTIPLVEYCREHEIELVTLYPNATHLYQPLDIAFFHPFKDVWLKTIPLWKVENNVKRMTNENFALVLKQAIESMKNLDKTIPNGFKSSGLVPFNADAVDYNILNKKKKKKSNHSNETQDSQSLEPTTPIYEDIQKHIVTFESNLPTDILESFKMSEPQGSWSGNTEMKGLFEYWLGVKEAADISKKKPVIQSIVNITPNDALYQAAPCSESIINADEICNEVLAFKDMIILSDNLIGSNSIVENVVLSNEVDRPISGVNHDQGIQSGSEIKELFIEEQNDLSNNKCEGMLSINDSHTSISENDNQITSNFDTESNEDSKELNNFTEVHPIHPTTNEIPSLRNDQENSNYIANQADQTSKLTSNFQKVFPIEHLAEKKRKKAISSKTPRLPSAGCSDAWIENKMKKFQDQQQKEKEKLERQRIMEEKKKLADEKKKLNQQITELQKKLKKEKK